MATEAGSSAGAAPDAVAAAHEVLRHTHGIQFAFAKAPPPPKPPAWMEGFLKALEALGPVLKWVFWGGLAAGALLIVWFILMEFLPERRGVRERIAATDLRPSDEAAQALLEDADALAAQGRFEAAIHLLLFRSIDDLANRRPGLVRPALTSRDIAGLDVLPTGPRGAFARLAEVVELGFFGGQPLGEADFAAARQDYEAFAGADGWA